MGIETFNRLFQVIIRGTSVFCFANPFGLFPFLLQKASLFTFSCEIMSRWRQRESYILYICLMFTAFLHGGNMRALEIDKRDVVLFSKYIYCTNFFDTVSFNYVYTLGHLIVGVDK